jgi:hypothetical protein
VIEFQPPAVVHFEGDCEEQPVSGPRYRSKSG